MTAKQLEKDTGCKIMVRGKGSMRDKMKVCKMNKFSKMKTTSPLTSKEKKKKKKKSKRSVYCAAQEGWDFTCFS